MNNVQDWESMMTIHEVSEEKGAIYLDNLQENLNNKLLPKVPDAQLCINAIEIGEP